MKKFVKKIPLFVMAILISGFTQSINLALAFPGQGTLYAVEPLSIALYTVDNAGVFTLVGNTVDVNNNAVAISTLAFDHTTGIMYGGSANAGFNPGNLYIVNPTTAAVTLVGPTNNGIIDALDLKLDGVLYASMNIGGGGGGAGASQLATINTNTGDAKLIGPFGVGGMGAIAFGNDGILYGVTKAQSNNLYTININSGQATFVTQVTGGFQQLGQDGPASMQFACGGTVFLGTQFNDRRFGTLNIQNGAFTFLSVQPFDTVGGLTYDDTCSSPLGGELIPIDTTALLLAGIQTNYSILTVLAAVAAGAFGALYYSIKKKN